MRSSYEENAHMLFLPFFIYALVSPETCTDTESESRAAELAALLFIQIARQYPAAIFPTDKPVPFVTGELKETPDGAVISLAIVNACADEDPIALAAVVSTPIAQFAPPDVSAEIHTTALCHVSVE